MFFIQITFSVCLQSLYLSSVATLHIFLSALYPIQQYLRNIEEDPYLLELIRYIHLNPLRAKLVKDLKELDKYLWSGHSALLGRRKSPLIPKLEKEAKINPENPACPVKSEGHLTGVKKEKSLAEKTIEDVLFW